MTRRDVLACRPCVFASQVPIESGRIGRVVSTVPGVASGGTLLIALPVMGRSKGVSEVIRIEKSLSFDPRGLACQRIDTTADGLF